ncbi:MAG: DUF1844 domain-containing protein [bacterium]|nr:DUF1844 domain-containing protein [bacterium]
MSEDLKESKLLEIINPFYLQALSSLKMLDIPGVESKLDLKAANHAITLLDYLKNKMNECLNPEEKKIFDEILNNLKYLYLQKQNEKSENSQKEEK